jgi:RNA polymerase sigma factor (sigma-70 family)
MRVHDRSSPLGSIDLTAFKITALVLKRATKIDSVLPVIPLLAMRDARPSLGDRELVDRIRIGDAAAETEFARRYLCSVRAMMLARTRNYEDAEDLAQDTLVAVLQALRRGAMASSERLAAFVHGTARNVANNYVRVRERRPTEVPLSEDVPATPATPLLESEERLALALHLLARQGKLDREILRMSLVDGLTPVQIGRALHMRPELVRTHKYRAAHRLVADLGAS